MLLINGTIDDGVTQTVIKSLYDLAAFDPKKRIELVLNSPGGSVEGAFMIINVMETIETPVHTTALGKCHSSAAVILAAGEPGSRAVHTNARVMIHDVKATGSINATINSTSDLVANADHIQDAVDEMKHTAKAWVEMLARLTGQDEAKLTEDLKRDKFLTAAEAVDYGLADLVRAPKPRERKRAREGDGGVFGNGGRRLGGRAEADGNDVIDLTKVKPEAPPAEPSPSIAASRPKRAAARKK